MPSGVRTASEWSWRLLIIAIGIYAVVWLLAQISEVTIPIIVALLLAALLHPLKAAAQRIMPNGAAAGITVVGTLAVLVALFSFVGSQFSTQFADLTVELTKGLVQIRDWISSTFGISDTQISEYLSRARNELTSGDTSLGERAAAAGLTAGHTVAGFFMAMFALFFFLADGPRIWSWVVRLFPRGARQKIHSSGLIAWDQLSAFARATILVAAVDAIGIGVGAAVLGVPFASGIGLLVFFGAFVPVVGAAVSGGVAVVLALVALGPIKALIMLGIVIAVQQLESHILQPILIGRAMSVHPLAIIFGIATGVVLAGIIGALIAVPVVAVSNAVGRHLLSADPAPDDAEAYLTPSEQAEVDAARAEAEAEARARAEGMLPGASSEDSQ